MNISSHDIADHNDVHFGSHKKRFDFLKEQIEYSDLIVNKLVDFQIAIPSWALGTGGTRFGRFPGGGEPINLEQKIEDIGLLHSLNRTSGAISLHIPWDSPKDAAHIKKLAAEHELRFDAMNSNTFQDQHGQKHSYKFGSLQSTNKETRKQAIDHNIEVIEYGKALGSKSMTVWLADGSSFPGQLNFRTAFQNTLESLQEIYAALPAYCKLFIEYKSFEPNFYSTTVGDWGQSLLYANKLGPKAYALVDLGHHLPNANIEQIVALLLMEGKLGGFHFNDSKYGDDDLTAGRIKPYQLFLIFCELTENMDISFMIDASHNIKDPLEDLLQSVEAISLAYAQSLLVGKDKLKTAQENNDVAAAQEILQSAFRTDLRPLVAEARLRAGAALDPLSLFRTTQVRKQLIAERGYDEGFRNSRF
jgi:L-rhamnose isomerase / sugar isomerase